MNNKVPMPVVGVVIALAVIFLIFIGRKFLSPPAAVHTAPPSWYNAKTGAPGGATNSSGQATR